MSWKVDFNDLKSFDQYLFLTKNDTISMKFINFFQVKLISFIQIDWNYIIIRPWIVNCVFSFNHLIF
jgi:hypothetical protein